MNYLFSRRVIHGVDIEAGWDCSSYGLTHEKQSACYRFEEIELCVCRFACKNTHKISTPAWGSRDKWRENLAQFSHYTKTIQEDWLIDRLGLCEHLQISNFLQKNVFSDAFIKRFHSKYLTKYHQEYSKTVDVLSGRRINLVSADYTIKQLLLVPFCQFIFL